MRAEEEEEESEEEEFVRKGLQIAYHARRDDAQAEEAVPGSTAFGRGY